MQSTHVLGHSRRAMTTGLWQDAHGRGWLRTGTRVCGRGALMARCLFPPSVRVDGIDDNVEPKEEKS
jgi:hypothetical protein